MHPFRLVATDIDGTLIHTDGTLSKRTLDVIQALPVPMVLVTGRPVRWMRQLYDQMPEPLPAVCANGAVVYDPDTDEVLRARTSPSPSRSRTAGPSGTRRPGRCRGPASITPYDCSPRRRS